MAMHLTGLSHEEPMMVNIMMVTVAPSTILRCRNLKTTYQLLPTEANANEGIIETNMSLVTRQMLTKAYRLLVVHDRRWFGHH